VAHGAERVPFADARQAEGQDIRGGVEEGARGEFLQPLHDRHGQASGVERLEGLPRRQARHPTQAGNATLTTGFGLGVEHLDEDRHGLLMPGLRQARHDFLGCSRDTEGRQERRQSLRGGWGAARQHRPPPTSNAS
jgi:hypothetical protein